MDSNDITRRRVLSTVGAAGVAGLAGCNGGDGEDGDGGTPSDGDGDGTGDGGTSTPGGGVSGNVRLGWFNPHSGALAYYGNSTLWGFYSGLKYKGDDSTEIPAADSGAGEYEIEVGDVTYQMIVSDSAGEQSSQSIAEEYVNDFDVDFLVGGTSSAAATTVANNVANETQTPYMVAPAAGHSITGSSESCSDNVYRASETVAMDALSGGTYVANETDIESVWIYYANYSFGKDVRTNYKRVLEANGVTIDGETALAPDYSDDWEGQFQKAVDAGSDGIVGGFTVAGLTPLFQTFLNNLDQYDFRAVGGHASLAGQTALGQIFQQALGDLTEEKIKEANLGPFTSRYHWNQYSNDINDALIDFHTEQFGNYPDLFTGGAFTAASAIHQAVQEGGSTDGDDIRTNLKGMTVTDTPKGEGAYTFQEHNNQAKSPMTVSNMLPTTEENSEFWSAAVQPGDPLQTYGQDETTPEPDTDVVTCSL